MTIKGGIIFATCCKSFVARSSYPKWCIEILQLILFDVLTLQHEKLRQLECQREQTFRLMLEKEQRYAEALRSELAKCTDPSNEQQISRDLMGAERRIRTLQEQLNAITSNHNFNTLPSSANNGLIDVQVSVERV
jgi:hypothetical protein